MAGSCLLTTTRLSLADRRCCWCRLISEVGVRPDAPAHSGLGAATERPHVETQSQQARCPRGDRRLSLWSSPEGDPEWDGEPRGRWPFRDASPPQPPPTQGKLERSADAVTHVSDDAAKPYPRYQDPIHFCDRHIRLGAQSLLVFWHLRAPTALRLVGPLLGQEPTRCQVDRRVSRFSSASHPACRRLCFFVMVLEQAMESTSGPSTSSAPAFTWQSSARNFP